MDKKQAINILDYIKGVVKNDSNELRDLSYSFENDTITQTHPTYIELQHQFYDGVRSITMRIEYKDNDLVKKEREKFIKWMSEPKGD